MIFKEVNKTENVGTIEYAIKHPEEFIMMNENVENSDNDWLYYNEPEPAGNQYLWGNPYSVHHMVNIGKIMKTIYDPCPAGYKVPPQDVYGAFLKNPVIEYVGEYNNQTNAYIQKEDFYPLLATEYGAYFHYGKNGDHSVYFISGSHRYGRIEFKGLKPFFYTGHTSGTGTKGRRNGNNSVLTLSLFIKNPIVADYGFGGGDGWDDRATAGSIRCVRDE